MKLFRILIMTAIKFIGRYWWSIIWFGMAIVLYALQQALTFYYPYDNGFWSLHTHGSRFDAWHVSGVLLLTCMAMGMMPKEKKIRVKLIGLAVFGVVNYVIHEYFLHWIFKP